VEPRLEAKELELRLEPGAKTKLRAKDKELRPLG
jgi:hypothetical protein